MLRYRLPAYRILAQLCRQLLPNTAAWDIASLSAYALPTFEAFFKTEIYYALLFTLSVLQVGDVSRI